MKEPRKTCVVYCRTSTTGQKEADTIEAQYAAARRIIEAYGLEVLPYGPDMSGWIVDNGVSGSLLDGRTFSTFLDDLKAGKVHPDYLVVYSLSRIARVDMSSDDIERLEQSHVAAARIKSRLLARKVQVIDCDGITDPSSMTFDVKMMVATQEYREIRRRTMSGKARRLGEGAFAKGGKPPYGLAQVFKNGQDRKQGFALVPHPEDAPRLRQILEWYCEGGTGHAARKASEAGWPTPMHRTTQRKNAAKDWTPTRWNGVTVNNLVKAAPRYATGEVVYTFKDEDFTLRFEPLIDQATLARIERRQKEHTLKERTEFLATGFVDCACGAHINCRLSSQHQYARCAGGTKAASKGADMSCGSMRQEAFSIYLWSAVTNRLFQIQHAENVRAEGGAEAFDAPIAVAKAKIENIISRINTLVDMRLEGSLDKAVFAQRNADLNREKSRLVADLAKLEAEKTAARNRAESSRTVEDRIGDLLKEIQFGTPPLDKQRQILADLLSGDRVVVRWGPREVRGKLQGSSLWAEITMPAFGALPPFTFTTSRPMWKQAAAAISGKPEDKVGEALPPMMVTRDELALLAASGVEAAQQVLDAQTVSPDLPIPYALKVDALEEAIDEATKPARKGRRSPRGRAT